MVHKKDYRMYRKVLLETPSSHNEKMPTNINRHSKSNLTVWTVNCENKNLCFCSNSCVELLSFLPFCKWRLLKTVKQWSLVNWFVKVSFV